jgi:uncharacterized membrane protein
VKTPASIAGDPIHPMLVAIPIGLWIFSLVCDLVHLFGAAGEGRKIVALHTLGFAGALCDRIVSNVLNAIKVGT